MSLKQHIGGVFAALCASLLIGVMSRAAEPVLNFDSDTYVNLDDVVILAGDFTIEYWFKTARATNWRLINNSGSVNNSIGHSSANRIWTSSATIILSESFATDAWEHIAITREGSDIRIYRQAVEVGSGSWSGQVRLNRIGGKSGGTGWAEYAGQAADVRLWNIVRSQVEIETTMTMRLTGMEPGLVGYWPLNEGAGSVVADKAAGGGVGGTILNPEWDTTEDLELDPPPTFLYAKPFTLANIETGSTEFTNSNEVDVVDFPVPEGYDHWQINSCGTPNGIDPQGWTATNTLPDTVEFMWPSADTNVTLYAWFTNTSASVMLNRSETIIRFTETSPIPVVRTSYERGLVPGHPVVLEPEQIDNGSSGGESGEAAIPIHSMFLNLVAGPDVDATPEAPFVTVSKTGTYEVELVVQNAAGNVSTSSVCQVQIVSTSGNDFTWEGTEDNEWRNPINWNKKAVPVANADVLIATDSSVLLDADTPALNSFVISNNATLVFTNWNTTLNADTVTVGAKGTLTCAGPFRNEEMSNNVVVVCDSLVVDTNGKIDANGKGYAGATVYEGRGHGPGGSVSSGNNGGGAGHGGGGGEGGFTSIAPLAGGSIYGDPSAPIYAGSGGGSSTSYANYHGGDGGGAIRLTVSGHCLLEGPVSANGFQKSPRGGCGSGGSVFITCGTLHATSATVTADGAHGSNQSGGGGGGRIAVIVTDSAAQALLPKPDLVLSARRGVSANYEDGELGTLYLGNLDLIDPARYRHSGRLIVPGFVSWSPETLVIDGAAVQFSTNVFGLSVGGSLSVSGADSVLFTQPGSTLQIGGDLVLSNGATAYLPAKTDGLNSVAIGGDLVLGDAATAAGGSSLWVSCLVTNQPPDDTSVLVTVGGRMRVGSFSWVDLFSHTLTGGSALFRVGELTVATNGVINADGGGISNIGKGPGAGLKIGSNASGPYGGGGYGGLGGFGTFGGSGTTYGPVDAPIFPGSAGAIRFPFYYGLKPAPRSIANKNGHGGGLIRVEAEGRVRIDGTLTANGGDSPRGGGGSGGAISIRCRRFEGAPGSLLSANGGRYTNASVPTQDIAGGGGAGRIAIWRVSDAYQGAYSLLGGTSTHTDPAADGAPGEVFLGALPAEGTVLLLR